MFCSLSLCCSDACLSGAVLLHQAEVSTNVTYHTRLRPLYQGPNVNPSSLLLSQLNQWAPGLVGRLMGVNHLLRMEMMAECLGTGRQTILVYFAWPTKRPGGRQSQLTMDQSLYAYSAVTAAIRKGQTQL